MRRQQQLAAVEKRLQNQENRGIKNPDRVRRMQQKAEERERIQDEAAKRYDGTGSALKVTKFRENIRINPCAQAPIFNFEKYL